MKLTKLSTTGNFTELEVSSMLYVYFSYETPIALVKNGEVIVTENNWGPTTGKHINALKRMHPQHEIVPHDNLMFTISITI
mgnify:CR=1 FL=1